MSYLTSFTYAKAAMIKGITTCLGHEDKALATILCNRVRRIE